MLAAAGGAAALVTVRRRERTRRVQAAEAQEREVAARKRATQKVSMRLTALAQRSHHASMTMNDNVDADNNATTLATAKGRTNTNATDAP